MHVSESTLKTLGLHCALCLRRANSWGPHIGAGRQGGATGFLGRGSALDMAPRLSFLVDKVWYKAQWPVGRRGQGGRRQGHRPTWAISGFHV